jgi:chromodomain-helicase-DNA-binding protein 1
MQVKKFGNPSQIDLIAAEAGGVVEAAPPQAQIELLNLLIDGCQEATKENTDVKVHIPLVLVTSSLMPFE